MTITVLTDMPGTNGVKARATFDDTDANKVVEYLRRMGTAESETAVVTVS